MEKSDLPVPRADAALYARMSARVPAIARRTVARCVAEIPFYGLLPRDLVEGEITDLVAEHLHLYVRTLLEGRLPTEAELARPVRAAAGRAGAVRAGEWAPVAAVLSAYRIGGRIGWAELVRLAGPADTEDLTVAGAYLLEYLQVITGAVASAYLEEEQSALGERREARRALIEALLAGEPAAEFAERAELPIGDGHLVLQLCLVRDGADTGPAADQIAVRRRVNRLREELDGFARTPVLSRLDRDGGIALLPTAVPGDTGATRPAGPDDLAVLIDRIGAVSGSPVVAGVAEAAEVARIPCAAEEAREVALIAARLGRPPGLYRLEDVLLEFQLTRPGPARDRLAGRLDALSGHAALLGTLRMFLRLGNNRRQTAQALHIHPNTLDYRLRRVAAFTGLDPVDPADSRLLSAAITAGALLD